MDPILQSAKIAHGGKLHSVQLALGPSGLAIATYGAHTFQTEVSNELLTSVPATYHPPFPSTPAKSSPPPAPT
eukprot:4128330-Amphidinium_carterae.1